MSTFEPVLSGLPGLDHMLNNIRLGDNIVWQVSSMKEYLFFVEPYCRQAVKDGRRIIYMHFTGHPSRLYAGIILRKPHVPGFRGSRDLLYGYLWKRKNAGLPRRLF